MATEPSQLDKLNKAWGDLKRAVNVTLPSLKNQAYSVYLRTLQNPPTRGK